MESEVNYVVANKKDVLSEREKLDWEAIQAIQRKRRSILAEHRANHWKSTVLPKRETLQEGCFRLLEPIGTLDFYDKIFHAADNMKLFGWKGNLKKGQYTAILKKIILNSDGTQNHKKTHRVTVTQGCYELYDTALDASNEYTHTRAFCFTSPILFAGKKSTSKNARWLCAIAIDIDFIYEAKGYPQGLYNLLTDCVLGEIPTPTYLVCSGHGLHAYYVLTEPVPMFERNKKALNSIRKKLIRELWLPGHGITNLTSLGQIQYESLTQNFRVPGTLTKQGYTATDKEIEEDLEKHHGLKYFAKAYKLFDSRPYSIEELISWVAETETEYKNMYIPKRESYSYEQLLEMWPDWTRRHFYTDPNSKHYKQRRPPSAVLKAKEHKGKCGWKSHKSLYEWWLKRSKEVLNGHRYHYCMCLAAYAQKCEISKEEFEKDIRNLYETFKEKDSAISKWTHADEQDAVACYDTPYLYRLGVERIEAYSGLRIEKKKKNGHTKEQHIKIMRAIRDIEYPDDSWRNLKGQPTKENFVEEWRLLHPEGTKAQCIKETGLSKHTVYKWWNFSQPEAAEFAREEEKKEVI